MQTDTGTKAEATTRPYVWQDDYPYTKNTKTPVTIDLDIQAVHMVGQHFTMNVELAQWNSTRDLWMTFGSTPKFPDLLTEACAYVLVSYTRR